MPVDISNMEDYILVTLNNPPLNVITMEMVEELLDFFGQKQVKPIILTGEGENFSAGADIKQLSKLSEKEAAEFSEKGQLICSAIEKQRCVVAAIEGCCLGEGLELALACDARVSVAKANLGMPQIKLGLIPSWGGTIRLPKLIGQDAFNFIRSGEPVIAEEALALGLIDIIVPEEKLLGESKVLCGTQQQHEAKRYTNTEEEIKVHPSLVFEWPQTEEEEGKQFLECCKSIETKEKIREFLEK